jgi:hypothetical protein
MDTSETGGADFSLGESMTETLDHPPIILRQDPLKLTLLLLFSAVLTTIAGLSLWSGNTRSVFWSYVLLLIFAGGGAAVAWSLVRPSTIILDRSGITYRTQWRIFQYEWRDFADFIVWSPRWPIKWPGFKKQQKGSDRA